MRVLPFGGAYFEQLVLRLEEFFSYLIVRLMNYDKSK